MAKRRFKRFRVVATFEDGNKSERFVNAIDQPAAWSIAQTLWSDCKDLRIYTA